MSFVIINNSRVVSTRICRRHTWEHELRIMLYLGHSHHVVLFYEPANAKGIRPRGTCTIVEATSGARVSRSGATQAMHMSKLGFFQFTQRRQARRSLGCCRPSDQPHQRTLLPFARCPVRGTEWRNVMCIELSVRGLKGSHQVAMYGDCSGRVRQVARPTDIHNQRKSHTSLRRDL